MHKMLCTTNPVRPTSYQRRARLSAECDDPSGLGLGERLRLRQLQSQPLLEKLRNYLLEIQGGSLAEEPGGAGGTLPPEELDRANPLRRGRRSQNDNNATERAIRSVAVGRNNWVFFGSDEGGKTAAVLRSFVASCQRVGVDPFVWLKDILSRIADHPITRIAELLPHNWVSAQT